MNVLKLAPLVVVCSVVASSPKSAEAFSFTLGGTAVVGEGYQSSLANAQTVDFNSGTAGNNFIQYAGLTSVRIVQGSQAGGYLRPLGDDSRYLALGKGSYVEGITDAVTLNFANAIDYFGLYWGSVDSYNFIDFYRDNQPIATFGGADISTTARNPLTGGSDNLYVNFFASPAETFNKVVLRTNGLAFETDNHAVRMAATEAIPEPFAIGGSLVGLAFILSMKKLQRAKVSSFNQRK